MIKEAAGQSHFPTAGVGSTEDRKSQTIYKTSTWVIKSRQATRQGATRKRDTTLSVFHLWQGKEGGKRSHSRKKGSQEKKSNLRKPQAQRYSYCLKSCKQEVERESVPGPHQYQAAAHATRDKLAQPTGSAYQVDAPVTVSTWHSPCTAWRLAKENKRNRQQD